MLSLRTGPSSDAPAGPAVRLAPPPGGEGRSTDNPIGTEVVFEDDRVRVWRIVLEPSKGVPVSFGEGATGR